MGAIPFCMWCESVAYCHVHFAKGGSDESAENEAQASCASRYLDSAPTSSGLRWI